MAFQKAVSPVRKDEGSREQNSSSGLRRAGALGTSGSGEDQAAMVLQPAVTDGR